MGLRSVSQSALRVRRRVLGHFVRFLRAEAMGGLVLVATTAIALWLANSRFAGPFAGVWQAVLPVSVSGVELHLSLGELINEGLMASFFLLVGLELKRELLVGELNSLRRAALPAVAALGGMGMPALVYLGLGLVMAGGAQVAHGWAVPTATDIAFTVGVLTLLGKRVPLPVKVFVTALAIVDDLGAVLIIALMYSAKLHAAWLGAVAGLTVLLGFLNFVGVRSLFVYLLLGALLWVAMLHSGVHATIAGVILGMAVPLRDRDGKEDIRAPLHRLAHALQYPVALGVLPLFALSNAGLALRGGGAAFWQPETAGIFFGLLFGKPLGILLATYGAVRLRICMLPLNLFRPWRTLGGAAMLCGIGFTMSLFTAQLAFFGDGAGHLFSAKLGIWGGSLASALLGALFLRIASQPRHLAEEGETE